MTLRGLLLWIHLLLGLTGAMIIAIASVTGAYITLNGPLERLLIPVPRVSNSSVAPDLPAIVASIDSEYAPRHVTGVQVRPGEAVVLTLGDRSRAFIDPADGTVIRFRQMRIIRLENLNAVMRGLHVNLLMGPRGRLIVTLATVEAMLLILTGIWLWWRKKHWRFTAWRGSAYRVSWDLHNATGLWFLLPALSMTLTGALLYWPAVVHRISESSPAPWPGAPRADVHADSTRMLPIARLLAIADSVRPGESVRGLAIPRSPTAAFAVEKPTATVYLNRASGDVIEVRPLRVMTRGDSVMQSIEHLHTGKLLGGPGEVIMALGSLMLAVMTVTGVILGWKRILILTRRMAESD